MSLPNYLAKIKSSGIYRFVWDKSTITNTQAETLRLVVGYSEKGPFNTPVYVENSDEFRKIFGGINKKLERRGIFFHRMALQALSGGPILALNLKKISAEEKIGYVVVGGGVSGNEFNISTDTASTTDTPMTSLKNVYNISRFWSVDPDKLLDLTNSTNEKNYITIAATDDKSTSKTFVMRPTYLAGYDVTLRTWYTNLGEEIPEYLENYSHLKVSDFLAEIYVFNGKFTPSIAASPELTRYFDVKNDQVSVKQHILNAFGEQIDALDALSLNENSGFIQKYVGVVLPNFRSLTGSYISLDVVFNADYDEHKMIMKINENTLEEYAESTTGYTPAEVSTFDWASKIAADNISKVVTAAKDFEDSAENDKTLTYTPTCDLGESVVKVYSENINNINYSLSRLYIEQVENSDSSQLQGEGSNTSQNKLDPNSTTTSLFWSSETGGTNHLTIFDVTHPNVSSSTTENVLTLVFNADEEGSEAGLNDAQKLSYDNIKSYITSIFLAGNRYLVPNGGDSYAVVNCNDVTIIENYHQKVTISVTFDKNLPANVCFTSGGKSYIIKCDSTLMDMGSYDVTYLEGYTRDSKLAKPLNLSIPAKLAWQNEILDVLNPTKGYAGLVEALTNRVDIDYRYIVDTFESYPTSEIKSRLSLLAKKKDNCLLLTNWPSVKSFIDSTGYTDSNGIFASKYLTGKNLLPTEENGASWCSFNTPVVISDGVIRTNCPAAALVSNNFMAKYAGREPYYVVAGPNYGRLSANGLIGPDYNYSRADLDILEPMGVNATVYVPRKGTYINSNQTAKQNPVTALSKINVRELVIYLQDQIEDLLQKYQWEFNTSSLRERIKMQADSICQQVQLNGGLYDFDNICDETNNTPDVINNEMIVLHTLIEPGMGAGKMVQELTIYKNGDLRASIS